MKQTKTMWFYKKWWNDYMGDKMDEEGAVE